MAEMLTAADVAARIGVTVQTLYSYVARGSGPVPDGHLGRTPWWSAETIDAWQNDRPGRGAGGGRPTQEERAIRDAYMEAHRELTDYALATPIRDLTRFQKLQTAEREAKARWDEVLRSRGRLGPAQQ